MSSSKHINVVAIITPKPGKLDRAIEIMTELNRHVERDEPDALIYHFLHQTNSEDGSDNLVVIEQYKDQAAFDHHCNSQHFLKASKTWNEEELLAKSVELKMLKPVAGFLSR